jgi:Na+-translocating ferredoxin:NAD+ oxidoreductase RnfD subunit
VTVRQFFRTPKGLLIVILLVLLVPAAWSEGIALVAPGLAGAAGTGMLLDVAILRLRERKWVFPDGALLTGLIVAMILSPHEPWYVAAITSAIGVVSKYLFRVHTANVFNPAALALVGTFYVFDTAQSWWGALPEIAPAALAVAGLGVLFATGIFISDRVNKMPVVLSFLGTYYALFTVSAFLGTPARVAELYRAPDLQAALFFAFFMVTDPPTSPPRSRDQLIYGVIVAVVSYLAFELIGAAYFLLAGLLLANVWEAWRRSQSRAAKAARQPTA